MIENKLFNNDVKIHSQSIRGIYYTTIFGEDLYFDKNNELNFSCEYDILIHKDNPREFIIIMEYSVIEPGEENQKNELHIAVEGRYEINSLVDENSIDEIKHRFCLSSLMAFLRMSVFNITSMTLSGSHSIPPINLEELHKQFNKKIDLKKENLKSKKRKK